MTHQRRKNAPVTRGSVSRREFIQDVVAASAATGVVGTFAKDAQAAGRGDVSIGAGATAGDMTVLTAAQGVSLTAVLNQLIPAGAGMPAAGDVQVVRYIDGVMADAPHLRQPILGLLTQLPDAEQIVHLPVAELEARLASLQQAQPEQFAVLLQATYTGYYSHPTVLAKLGWLPPGQDQAESFDVRLLDDVIARGPIYRHV